MSKAKQREPFVAGWLFWAIAFGVLCGPFIYLFWHWVEEQESRVVPVAIGALFAAVGAGVIAWALNAVLEFVRAKQRRQERKKGKKR